MPHVGQIVHVNKDGLLVVEETNTHSLFALKFGVLKGYNGQTARSFGLTEGKTVRFDTRGDKVVKAELAV